MSPVYTHRQAAVVAANGSAIKNYGLWYNKFIPVNGKFESCDSGGVHENAVEYYRKTYEECVRSRLAADMLRAKHACLDDLCGVMSHAYEIIKIRARLMTPMITGIGQSHPHETSMLFEHNIGVPYIPASSVKGVARFAHLVDLVAAADDLPAGTISGDKLYEGKTDIPALFGEGGDGEGLRGSVMFLDAYPEAVPELFADIINPHYPGYYQDKNGRTAPADNMNPILVKLLAVKPGAVFVFRALVRKRIPEGALKVFSGLSKFTNGKTLAEMAREAIEHAIVIEGVGAKTATGYGRFVIGGDNERRAGGSSVPGSSGAAQAVPKSRSAPKGNVEIGKECTAIVSEVARDKGSIVVEMPDGKKCQMGKSKLPADAKPASMKAGQKIVVIARKVLPNGSYEIEFVKKAP